MKILKELFGSGAGVVEPEPFFVPSGVEGLVWTVKDRGLGMMETQIIGNHSFNVELLRRDGIEPLSFNQIEERLPSIGENITSRNWVLFDNHPVLRTGNSWLVVSSDDDQVELAFGAQLGHTIWDNIEPFEISKDEPFFSGVTVVELTDDEGGLVTLGEERSFREENPELDMDIKSSCRRYWVEGAKVGLSLFPWAYI